MRQEIMEEYKRWLEKADRDPDLKKELASLDEKMIEDAFYTSLTFGTAGLRGIIGAGTNRMNIYTVALASKAMAEYVLKKGVRDKSVAIAYDSRIKSQLFSETAAAVFATAGVKVYLYPELMPTPCLSFAVRELGCSAGVMVTASHNPAAYNGYKAYGPDGCQMTEEDAGYVYSVMQTFDCFEDVDWRPFDELLAEGKIEYTTKALEDSYIAKVRERSVLPADAKVDKSVSIVYTPLNGAGRKPVIRILKECGFTNISVVKEQEEPDGNFPTCPYPNPEMREAMALGVEYCRKLGADLLVATDPDSDRCSIAVKLSDGSYRILSGNELGCLLLDYICSMRKAAGTLPSNGLLVKSVVTTDMAARIAAEYGLGVKNVLTGFKYIGEQIHFLEERHEEDRYVFGFEESCGFLSGTYVRDKDAVVAAMLVAEMYVYEKSIGSDLAEKLEGLYKKFGYFANKVVQFEYPGIEGKAKMQEILAFFRKGLDSINGVKVVETLDYLTGIDGLPKADVLKYTLASGDSVIIRPSGTEPKVKAYITAAGATAEDAKQKAEAILTDVKQYL